MKTLISATPAWKALETHAKSMRRRRLRYFFAQDPARFQRFSLNLEDILFDFSKNRISVETIPLLVSLAEEAGLAQAIEATFTGEKINTTEKRAVLHTALRNPSDEPLRVDGEDIMPEIRRVKAKMRRFSEQIRSGEWRGYSGKRIRDVVNIGIGGSDLGPKMVCKALTPYGQADLRMHFVSNVDSTDLSEVLKQVEADQTLFLIASKTFTTQETMANAHSAREWFLARAGDEKAVARHFAAMSTNTRAVAEFGIDPENMFEFWDWVGGRYSVWSAIGLPVAIYLGMDQFEQFLAGAHAADQHFRQAAFDRNIPVLMGLLEVWYINFFGCETQAILPYDQYFEYFPAYLQQSEMESNGKHVTSDGQAVNYQTGAVIWGQVGTNGQHAFYQLIHQGTRLIPCDFLVAAQSQNPLGDHQALLLANVLAQSEALMKGRTREEALQELKNKGVAGEELASLAAARTFQGNIPSNTFLYTRLTPHVLGSLISLYEHKIFTQGIIWGLNSFDQMGVELGKQLAQTVLSDLRGKGTVSGHDSSTNGLIAEARRRMG